MLRLLKSIRYVILISSTAVAILIWYLSSSYDQMGSGYAFLAIGYLFASVLVTPLYFNFPKLPWKPLAIRARRAIGVSAFMFAALHGIVEFFFVYGGFSSLSYLSNSYILAFTFSAAALLILLLMTLSSFDFMVKRMGKYWKFLHRFVYLALILIFFHVLIVANSPWLFIAFTILILLEIPRIIR